MLPEKLPQEGAALGVALEDGDAGRLLVLLRGRQRRQAQLVYDPGRGAPTTCKK